MSSHPKITTTHLQRSACVYVRQSSARQVEHNRESTERQYALIDKACELGWSKDQVSVIDEDLGLSGVPMITYMEPFQDRLNGAILGSA